MAAILKPEESELIKAAGTIIKAIGQKYNTAIGTSIGVAEKINTVSKIVNVTTRFCHKLNSRLGVIESKLPSNAEMFRLYMQYFLTKEDSQAIYNNLISAEILNDVGKVIEKEPVKIVEKIRALDLEKNNQLKNAIIKFCIQSQDLQGKDKQETRDRIAFSAEQMITNRIMHLVKAEVLSPAISRGLGCIKDKLQQVSELLKHRVRQEMQKHYHKVTLTVDDANTEIPSDKPNIETPFSYLDFKKIGPKPFFSPITPSMLEGLLNPEGAAAQKALDAWHEDPRVKCHLPYERHASMLGSHHDTATTDTLSTEANSITPWDVETPTTSTTQPWYFTKSRADTTDDLYSTIIQEVTSSNDNERQSDTEESSSNEQRALCLLDQGQMGVEINKINPVQKLILSGVSRLHEIYREVEERKKGDIATYSRIVIDPAIMDVEKHPGTLRTLLNTNLLAVKYVGHVTTDLALKYSPTEFSTAVIAGGELIGYGVTNTCNLLQQVWEACAPNIAQESARALGSKMGELQQILKENTTSGKQFAMYLGAGLLGDKAFTKLFSARGNKVQLPSDNYAKIAAAPIIKEGALGGFVYRDSSSSKVVALFDSVNLTPKVELPKFAGLYGKEAVTAQLQHAQMIKRHIETMIEHGAMTVEASTALEQEIVLGKLVKEYQRQYGKYQQLSSLEGALAYELGR